MQRDDSDITISPVRRRNNSVWADEALVERLKVLWAEGFSASQVAAQLGHGLSRNAVIAKVHRIGLTRRTETVRLRKSKSGKRAKRGAAPKPPRPMAPRPADLKWEPFVPGPDLVIPADQRKGIADLEDDDCRWPIGDPQKDDFSFCNHKAVPGLPYCAHHCRRAYLTKPVAVALQEARTPARDPVDA